MINFTEWLGKRDNTNGWTTTVPYHMDEVEFADEIWGTADFEVQIKIGPQHPDGSGRMYHWDSDIKDATVTKIQVFNSENKPVQLPPEQMALYSKVALQQFWKNRDHITDVLVDKAVRNGPEF